MFKKNVFFFLCFLLLPGGLLQAGVINPNITQIVFITNPQTFDLGATSTVLTVQTQNASGTSEQVGATTKLNLSSTGGGEFSSSDTNWDPVSQLTMNSNWANRSFYYRPSTSGAETITVTPEGQTWTPATQIITVNPIITPDIISPVITLLGEAIINLNAGDSYADAGATALDDVDGDISSRIVFINPLNTLVPGNYVLTYDVSDLAGNPATQVSRTVSVATTSSSEDDEEGSGEDEEEKEEVKEETVIAPTIVSSSVSTGYVLGWKPISEGQVLGTSTEKIKPKLTAEQRKLRILKRQANQLAIKIYDLKHSQKAPIIIPVTSAPTASSSPAKKAFWKFW